MNYTFDRYLQLLRERCCEVNPTMTKGFVGNATSSLVLNAMETFHICQPRSQALSFFLPCTYACAFQKKATEVNMNTHSNSSYSRLACENSRHSSLPAARGVACKYPQRPRGDCICRLIPDHLLALSDIKLLRFSMTTFPEIVSYKYHGCTKGVIHGH